jgi:hypothetical protein
MLISLHLTEAQMITTIQVVPTSFAFDSLDGSPKYIAAQHGDWSYWGYLTSSALEVYEAIYESCKHPTGDVSCKFPPPYIKIYALTPLTLSYHTDEAFAQQFTSSHVSSTIIQTAWQRFAKPNTLLKRNHILAAVYMIHIRRTFPDANYEPRPFSARRWQILEHYGDWVKCGCGCDTTWSFANGAYGMQRGVNERTRECKVQRWRDAGVLGKVRWGEGKRGYEDVRRRWHGII